MPVEKTFEEEQKTHTELCNKLSEALDGVEYEAGFDALAAVQARMCVELDNSEGAALAQVENFLHYLRRAIEDIPAERIIDIPEPN